MPADILRQGQTAKWLDRWVTVTYLLPGDIAIISLDDGSQATISINDLTVPVVTVTPQDLTKRGRR